MSSTPSPTLFYPRCGQLVELCDGRRAVVNEALPSQRRAWRLLMLDVNDAPLNHERHAIASFRPLANAEASFDGPSRCISATPRIRAERARSNRTCCLRCASTITTRSVRVCVEFAFVVFGRITKETQWFHAKCFDPLAVGGLDASAHVTIGDDVSPDECTAFRALWQRVDDAQVPPVLVAPRAPADAVDWASIRRACRDAVHRQIEAFRNDALNGGGGGATPHCLITNEPLTRDNAHVHHQGESTTAFHDLVRRFAAEQTRVCRAEVSFAGFVDRRFAASFAHFHRAHAHLQLVHRSANLGVLRVSSFAAACSRCGVAATDESNVRHLPELRAWWCFACRRTVCVSQAGAMRTFALVRDDLASLPYATLPNPIYGDRSRGFAPMRLFLRETVETAAVRKHGSLDQAARKRRARETAQEERAKRRRIVEMVLSTWASALPARALRSKGDSVPPPSS
jgi:hypothetical protein